MGSRRREVSFMMALRTSKLRSLAWPEGVGALIVGCAGGATLAQYGSIQDRLLVATNSLRVLAPLLGVVLAALTFVISFASDDYIRHLKQGKLGVIEFYRPFIFALGIEIITILYIIGYQAIAESAASGLEGFLFVILSFLVVYSILNILAVARNVVMHALTRASLLD